MAKWYPGFFINRADADGVLLLAVPATPEIPLVPIASLGVHHLVHVHAATAHTVRCIAPALLFKEFYGCQFIRASKWDCTDDFGFREVVFVSFLIHAIILYLAQCFVKYKIVVMKIVVGALLLC